MKDGDILLFIMAPSADNRGTRRRTNLVHDVHMLRVVLVVPAHIHECGFAGVHQAQRQRPQPTTTKTRRARVPHRGVVIHSYDANSEPGLSTRKASPYTSSSRGEWHVASIAYTASNVLSANFSFVKSPYRGEGGGLVDATSKI